MTAPYWSNGVATLYQADARGCEWIDAGRHGTLCNCAL